MMIIERDEQCPVCGGKTWIMCYDFMCYLCDLRKVDPKAELPAPPPRYWDGSWSSGSPGPRPRLIGENE